MKQAEEADMSLKGIHFQKWIVQTFNTPNRLPVGTNGYDIFLHPTISLYGDDFKIEEKI